MRIYLLLLILIITLAGCKQNKMLVIPKKGYIYNDYVSSTLGVSVISVDLSGNMVRRDTSNIKDVCEERGHVDSGAGITTLAYCPPYIIDTDSTTVKVYPSCNTTTSYCQRCNSSIVSGAKEFREVIWKKLKSKDGQN